MRSTTPDEPFNAAEAPAELQEALRRMSLRGDVVDMGTGETVATGGKLVTEGTATPIDLPDEYPGRREDTPQSLLAEVVEGTRLRELLAVVLEGLDVPYAATVGGEEVRSKVVTDRAMKIAVTLRAVVAGLPRYTTISAQTAYLREALEEHPARGYVTWETAMARREAGQDYMQSVTAQTPDEGFEDDEVNG